MLATAKSTELTLKPNLPEDVVKVAELWSTLQELLNRSMLGVIWTVQLPAVAHCAHRSSVSSMVDADSELSSIDQPNTKNSAEMQLRRLDALTCSRRGSHEGNDSKA